MNAHRLSTSRTYDKRDARCSCRKWKGLGYADLSTARADHAEHVRDVTARELAISWSAYCICGHQRRDHIHTGQQTQHTPMADDAPRDCLGRCPVCIPGEPTCKGFNEAKPVGVAS